MNTCYCVDPPGGTASCEDNQLAICVVVNGVRHSHCITMPNEDAERAYLDVIHYLNEIHGNLLSNFDSSKIFTHAWGPRSTENFVLGIIKAEARDPDQEISWEDNQLLVKGEYSINDRIIRFRMPKETNSSPAREANTLLTK